MGKNISIFDDYFEPQIRERGIGYYYNDLIKNIKTKDHTSTATIEGTRVYQVELKLNEKQANYLAEQMAKVESRGSERVSIYKQNGKMK